MTIRTAIIGAGAIAEHHLKGAECVSEFKIAGICDLDRNRAEAVANQINAKTHTDWRGMLEEGYDAVVICVPHALHAEISITALESGHHVLVEKPMSVTPEECQAMLFASQRSNRSLMVAETGDLEC